MRLILCSMAVGLAGLGGCFNRGPDPAPVKPAGDTGTPDEEFRLAHQTIAQVGRRIVELRATADPGRSVSEQFPELVPLSRTLTAAREDAGRLSYAVGTTDPTGPLGADALYVCLLYSHEPPPRRRMALDLAVRHYPNDPRLGEYLFAVLGDAILPGDAGEWLPPVLRRVLDTSTNLGVLAAAQAGRGRLLLASDDPSQVMAGERLLASVVRHHPDERVGEERVAVWAGRVLAEHDRRRGAVGSAAVRLAP